MAAKKLSELKRDYRRFKKENPIVYKKFKKYAKQLFRNGRRRYSADAIVHFIRYEQDFTTRGDRFKINNNHVAYLARDLVREDKRFKGFFEKRHLRT